MATVVSVQLALAVKIVADTNINGASSDTVSRREAITTGFSIAFIASNVAGYDRIDANTRHVVAEFSIVVAHNLSVPTDEATYTTDDMLDDMKELMDHNFYRDVAGVYDVESGPELDPASRSSPGNVVEYTVTVQLAIES